MTDNNNNLKLPSSGCPVDREMTSTTTTSSSPSSVETSGEESGVETNKTTAAVVAVGDNEATDYLLPVKRQLDEDYQQNDGEGESQIEGGSDNNSKTKKFRKADNSEAFEMTSTSSPQQGPSTSSSSHSSPSTSSSGASSSSPSSGGSSRNSMPRATIPSSICFSVPAMVGMQLGQSTSKATANGRRVSNSSAVTVDSCHVECSGSTSLVQHHSCMYYPGSFSKGKMGKCSLYHCCHCQHPQSRYAAGRSNSSSSTSSSVSSTQPSTSTDRPYSSSSSSTASVAATTATTAAVAGATRARSEPRAESLLELAARVVAEHYPYECIEKRYRFIPEVVQRRILFWSFPRDESYIRLYSSISSIFKDDSYLSMENFSFSPGSNMPMIFIEEQQQQQAEAPMDLSSPQQQSQSQKRLQNTNSSLFNLGLSLMHFRAVHQVLQVGFNLSGVVTNVTPLNTTASPTCPFQSSISSAATSPTSYPSGDAATSSNSRLNNSIILNDYNRIPPFISIHSNGQTTATSPSVRDSTLFRKVSNHVSITFDRCKITSATCTCQQRNHHLFWCEHVVALALYRIHKPFAVELRPPISDTLLEFDRGQLQKLVQYLIGEHHVQILPTLQRLADDLLNKRSSINLLDGAPDPTAGACTFTRSDWHLNEERIKAQVRDLVRSVSMLEAKQIILLFYKVIEMLKIRDTNAPRFLHLITQQFFYSYAHFMKPEDMSQRYDPFIFLWDQLVNLWMFLVADINIAVRSKLEWRDMFRYLTENPNGPREDTYPCMDVDSSHPEYYQRTSDKEKCKRTFDHEYIRRHLIPAIRQKRIIERAFDATFLSWDDDMLRLILSHDVPPVEYFDCNNGFVDGKGRFIWSEHLPTAALRIASLRVNGHVQKARRLAMAVVRYLKHVQKTNFKEYEKNNEAWKFQLNPAFDSWLGNPIDPIGVIFDTLADASLTSDSSSIDSIYALVGYDKKMDTKNVVIELFNNYSEFNVRNTPSPGSLRLDPALDESHDLPKYQHVRVAGSKDENDTYLSAAVTVAIMGLAQERLSPDLESQRDKAFRQEERLLRKLLDIKIDPILLNVLRKQTVYLTKIGLLNDNVRIEHYSRQVPEYVAQIPGLVRYLFGALLSTDSQLAYDVGIRSLRYFALKFSQGAEVEERNAENRDRLRRIRNNHLFYFDVQMSLAKTMFYAARNENKRLTQIYRTLSRTMTMPTYYNKIAQDIYQLAHHHVADPRHEQLLRIAYFFGLSLIRMTLAEGENMPRQATVSWLVGCSSELGDNNLFTMIQGWREYFTPTEAVNFVATPILAGRVSCKFMPSSSPSNRPITDPNDPGTSRLYSRCPTHTRIGGGGNGCSHCLDKLMSRQKELMIAARNLAIESATQDPAHCAFAALTLCEKDQYAFDTIAQVIEQAGSTNKMSPPSLFNIARYMEQHHMSERACRLALLASAGVYIPITADTHHLINDLQWACMLTLNQGPNELTELVRILVKNVHCAPVLANLLRKCLMASKQMPTGPIAPPMNVRSAAGAAPGVHGGAVGVAGGVQSYPHDLSNHFYVDLSLDDRTRRNNEYGSGMYNPKTYSLDRAPLSILLNAAVSAFIDTVMTRLEHISPRHYSDFIDFLSRAQETMIMAPNGKREFASLLEKIKTLYKGKKKLMSLVRERFG